MANSMRDYGPARKSIYSSHFTYLSVRKSRAEQDWDKAAVARIFYIPLPFAPVERGKAATNRAFPHICYNRHHNCPIRISRRHFPPAAGCREC
jgi:hypothetical protein